MPIYPNISGFQSHRRGDGKMDPTGGRGQVAGECARGKRMAVGIVISTGAKLTSVFETNEQPATNHAPKQRDKLTSDEQRATRGLICDGPA